MDSEVFTKSEILQTLAKRGYFIDSYTLDTFFQKWKIEAIFEDEQGGEFFDKNSLELVLNKLFNDTLEIQQKEENEAQPRILSQIDAEVRKKFYEDYIVEEDKEEVIEMPKKVKNQAFEHSQYQQFNTSSQMPNMQQYNPNMQNQYIPNPQFFQGFPPQYQQFVQPNPYQQPQFQQFGQYQQFGQNFNPQNQELMNQYQSMRPNAQNNNVFMSDIVNNPELDILRDISLSDGTPLINKVADLPIPNASTRPSEMTRPVVDVVKPIEKKEEKKEKKLGILAGALEAQGIEFNPDGEDEKKENKEETDSLNQEEQSQEVTPLGEDDDYDDMSLLSESFEAQEKFKEYIVSQMTKKNIDLTPPPMPTNEFKLDISEKTIGMVARTMAKKIAKHVSSLTSQDTKANEKLLAIQEQNKRLEVRANELEEQNRKLRLLLAESNKNLNSYKPTIFGFYKKVSTD